MKIPHPQWTNQEGLECDAHHDTPGRRLADAILVTAEICGQALSPAAAEMLADDLADFDETVILAALARCRMELQGSLKMPEILARISDGRPDADEAWAMLPQSELSSVVWTDEMAKAWGIAMPLLEIADVSNARTTFREGYDKAVLEARLRHEPPRWTPSFGSDVADRERALLDALRKRRLSAAHVAQLLPPASQSMNEEEAMVQVKTKTRIEQRDFAGNCCQPNHYHFRSNITESNRFEGIR